MSDMKTHVSQLYEDLPTHVAAHHHQTLVLERKRIQDRLDELRTERQDMQRQFIESLSASIKSMYSVDIANLRSALKVLSSGEVTVESRWDMRRMFEHRREFKEADFRVNPRIYVRLDGIHSYAKKYLAFDLPLEPVFLTGSEREKIIKINDMYQTIVDGDNINRKIIDEINKWADLKKHASVYVVEKLSEDDFFQKFEYSLLKIPSHTLPLDKDGPEYMIQLGKKLVSHWEPHDASALRESAHWN